MSEYTKSYNLNTSEQDQSIDEDRICSILDCEAPATHHIETQGYDETISFAVCKNCSRSWEDDSKEMSNQIYDREPTRNEDKWTRFVKSSPFYGNAVEIVEKENGRLESVRRRGQYHHCLRDRRNSV